MQTQATAQRGFTLIEIICTILILGIIGSGLVFGFSSFFKGWALTHDITAQNHQVQTAMKRLRIEFSTIPADHILESSPIFVRFIPSAESPNAESDPSQEATTLEFESNTHSLMVNDNVLLKNVQEFTLGYLTAYDATPSNSASLDTTLIKIHLVVDGANDVPQAFDTKIALAK